MVRGPLARPALTRRSFSVYRIRTVELKPLIISNEIVKEYGQNKVETLHVKNLLSLGEDRYLTTIMMKEYPEFKMAFCREALAQTIAPDDWKVLMSQRRRWINSTVHNLAELLFVDRMCGFCCFSMRFVVFIDLASTLIAPVTYIPPVPSPSLADVSQCRVHRISHLPRRR